MKVYLDDERPTPDGWVRCYWPDEVIALLQKGGVTHLSLDHDLGNDDRGTGYDVVLWLEKQVHTNPEFVLPGHLAVHSANVSARVKMESGLESLQKHYRERR